jgi:hypothetical protein
MKKLKLDSTLSKDRFLDPIKKSGTKRTFYSELIFEALQKEYE